MIKTAFLRVYEPLRGFSEEERDLWSQPAADLATSDGGAGVRWLVASALPVTGQEDHGAFIKEAEGEILVCPQRTRMRMLIGLLAFRNSLPDEVADAFVPEREARRAVSELDGIRRRRPGIKSHILHANWHVPLRWFAAFSDDERILVEDQDGLRIRYETTLGAARERLERCVGTLEIHDVDDDVVTAAQALLEWVRGFGERGLLELDYASVATLFTHEELLEDRSAGEVEACLEALSSGDVLTAGRIFNDLGSRWTETRAREVVN